MMQAGTSRMMEKNTPSRSALLTRKAGAEQRAPRGKLQQTALCAAKPSARASSNGQCQTHPKGSPPGREFDFTLKTSLKRV